MKKRTQYNNFKEGVYSKVIDAIESIHISISNKHYIFSFLCKHEHDIRNAGIDFDKLSEFNDNDLNCAFYINKNIKISEDEILNEIIYNNINTFIYLSYVKINTLLNYIKYMTYLYNMTYSVYLELIKGLNQSIIKTVIEGNSYSFGFGLSSIHIKRGKRSENKKAVNWEKSNKKRKELKQTTGEKEKWIVYHESPYYNFYYWNKGSCNVVNHRFYNFKVTNFINIEGRNINNYYSKVSSFEEIMSEDNIGNLQKLNAAVKLNPELVNSYLNN